mgnify:CR=1 FL=1
MKITLKGIRVSTKNKSAEQLKRLIKCIRKSDAVHPKVAQFVITMLQKKIERMLVS